MKRAMAKYTEQDLKRAFELGCTASVQLVASDSVDFNTPEWVHQTNMSLFVWSKITWDRARAWILATGPRQNES